MKQKEYNEMLNKIKCSEEFKNKMENMLKNSPEKDQEYTDSVSSVERAPKFTLRRYAAAAAAFAIICGSVGTVWYRTRKDKNTDDLHEASDETTTDITTNIAETTIVTAANAVTTTTAVTTTEASSGYDSDKQQRIAGQIIDNVFSVEACEDAVYLPYSNVSFIYGITPIPTDISEFLHGFEWEQVEGDESEFQTGSGPFVFENVYRFFSSSHRLFVNERGQIWDGDYLVFNAKNLTGNEFASYLSKLSRDKELRVDPSLLRQDLDNALRKLCEENSALYLDVKYLREPDSMASGFEPFYIETRTSDTCSLDENGKMVFDYDSINSDSSTEVTLASGKTVGIMPTGVITADNIYHYSEGWVASSEGDLKDIYGDNIKTNEYNNQIKEIDYDLSSDWDVAPMAKYYPILKRITNRLANLPYTQANEFYANILGEGEDVQVTYNNNDNGHNVLMRFVVDKDFVIKEYTEYRDDQLICEFKLNQIAAIPDPCG